MADLEAAAAALGIPEVLVQRSAEARAQETGASVDEILAAWAGGGSAPAAAATPDSDEPDQAPETADEVEEAEAEEAGAAGEAAEQPEVQIEIPEKAPAAAASSTAVARTPVPAEVTAAEASNLPVVVTVPTTGIKERTNFAIPKWLATVFFVVPVIALFALGGSATGTCGEATELETNIISGEIVNCDGSPFEGSSVGGGGTNFIALGESLYQGGEVSGVNCAGCHGAGGGGGAGPALNGVLTVFSSCADHSEWIALGTGGLQAAGESTYGDTNKPLGGFGAPMPGFQGSLSAEQIAAVAAFERVRYGGQSPEEALVDCGLAEDEEPPAEGEGDAPAEEGGPGDEMGEGSAGEEGTEGGPTEDAEG